MLLLQQPCQEGQVLQQLLDSRGQQLVVQHAEVLAATMFIEAVKLRTHAGDQAVCWLCR
jgi:hypothetical protein